MDPVNILLLWQAVTTEPIETLEQFIEERYQLAQMKMPQPSSPSKEYFKPTEKKNKAKQKRQVVAADDDDIKSTPKRPCTEEVSEKDGAEEVTEDEIGLLRSINDLLI